MSPVVLAIDTSQGTAVSVLVAGGVVAEFTEANSMKHAEQIGDLISKALAAAKKEPDQVSLVAVGLGPAPFTGLRVGLAAAGFFAQAVGARQIGVLSLDAIAFELELASPTLVITDARRGEVYFALYQGKTQAGIPIRLKGPGVMKLEDLQSQLAAEGIGYQLVSGELSPAALGKLALAQLAEGIDIPIQAQYLRAPDAVAKNGNPGKRVSG